MLVVYAEILRRLETERMEEGRRAFLRRHYRDLLARGERASAAGARPEGSAVC